MWKPGKRIHHSCFLFMDSLNSGSYLDGDDDHHDDGEYHDGDSNDDVEQQICTTLAFFSIASLNTFW